jgi:serine protease Do
MAVAPDANGGVVVRDIDPNSDAAAKGLRQGDVILRAGPHVVQSAADLAQAAQAARAEGRKNLPLLVARGGQHMYVAVGVKAGG